MADDAFSTGFEDVGTEDLTFIRGWYEQLSQQADSNLGHGDHFTYSRVAKELEKRSGD